MVYEIGLFTLLLGATFDAQAPATGSAVSGKAIYEQRCVRCHIKTFRRNATRNSNEP